MADEYVESGIPFLRSLNILPYRLDLEEVKYISPGFHQQLRKSSLRPGDVVVVRTGKPGTATVIPKDLEIANCSDLVIIRPGDGIDAKYLAYYFNSSAGRNHVGARLVGSVQKHFNIGDARRMKLRLPPPPVQERIADILGSLDDKIEANRAMNRTLEAMAQALYRHWFVDFGPFQDGPFEASGVGEIPAGWRAGSVLEACDLLSGGTPKTKVEEYWGGEIPWVSAKDINDGEVFISDTERKVTPLGVENSATKILPERTVVVVARGSVGKFGMLAREMAMNQSCYGLQGKAGFGQAWAYLMLSDLIRHLQKVAYGSVFDSITTSTFKSAQIVLPPPETLQRFRRLAEPLFDQIHANAEESRQLAETRDYLLPKLISGEVAAEPAREIDEAR